MASDEADAPAGSDAAVFAAVEVDAAAVSPPLAACLAILRFLSIAGECEERQREHVASDHCHSWAYSPHPHELHSPAATAFFTLSTISLLSSTNFWSSRRRFLPPATGAVDVSVLPVALLVLPPVPSASEAGALDGPALAEVDVEAEARSRSAFAISSWSFARRAFVSAILAASLSGAP